MACRRNHVSTAEAYATLPNLARALRFIGRIERGFDLPGARDQGS
jgi:hypothetical protein